MSTNYQLIFEKQFDKVFQKLDRQVQRRISNKLYDLALLEHPTDACKPLTGVLAGLWRVRVGDYRVIVDIRKNELIIIALDVGHRSGIYKR